MNYGEAALFVATLIPIVSIVVGILVIILFFKVWGMTNDVDKLMRHFCEKERTGYPPESETRRHPEPETKRPSNSLKAGDIVTRKSDGVKMRIDYITSSGAYTCFSADGKKHEGLYAKDELQ